MTWQPIKTAPKGSWLDGPHDVRHPDYVAPPHIWLLLPDGQRLLLLDWLIGWVR